MTDHNNDIQKYLHKVKELRNEYENKLLKLNDNLFTIDDLIILQRALSAMMLDGEKVDNLRTKLEDLYIELVDNKK